MSVGLERVKQSGIWVTCVYGGVGHVRSVNSIIRSARVSQGG